jgi:hypothetical protein
MAQQVIIDIVASTEKLTSGVNQTNSELSKLSGGISKTQQAAVGLASAFVLKEGVSFLKKANDEAIDAEKTAKAAASAFGEGSAALKKITDDATKFSDQLAVDNDDLIKLATGLGVRLPKDAQAASTELVLLAKNLEASSGGAIAAETTLSKLGKAFADGEVTAKELSKTIPGLTDSVYAQAEALSKAGKNQEAMTLLIDAGAKRYGGAAAEQVTGSERMTKAMGDLYEKVGTYVAPVIEKLSKFLSDLIGWVTKNSDVIVPLVAVLGTFAAAILILNAGLTAYNAIMAAWKVATTLATTAQTIFNAVMAANPIALVILAIVAIIAIIVLLVKNWDTVTEVVGKVWEAIKNFASDAWNVIKSLGSKIGGFVSGLIDDFKSIPGAMLNIGKDIVNGIWNGIQSVAGWLQTKITNFFGNLVPGWAKKVLGIGSPSKVFAEYGKFLVQGLALGVTNNTKIAKESISKLADGTKRTAKYILGIASPSKVYAQYGKYLVMGLAKGIDQNVTIAKRASKQLGRVATVGFGVNNAVSVNGSSFGVKTIGGLNKAYQVPTLQARQLGMTNGFNGANITINAGVGTDPYALGRTVEQALTRYGKISV